MQLPLYLTPYEKEAKELLATNPIKDVEFSGSTYQVLVADLKEKKEHWVFLQLQGNEKIIDAFCACEEGHHLNGCLHLAIAYLSIFDKKGRALHLRFSHSLWYMLCRTYEEMVGSNAQALMQLEKGHYICQFYSEKIVFSIHALTSEAIATLEKILHERQIETEETSLKFTNLSAEDILLWREGRPPPQLRFDLSFWSDLAKWWLALQDASTPYTITFRYSHKKLPNWIQINFVNCEIGFYLSEANLAHIIPTLNSVHCPLKVDDGANEKSIELIYDKKAAALHLVQKPLQWNKNRPLKEGQTTLKQTVGEWSFIPEEGFFPSDPKLLSENTVFKGEDLSNFLSTHSSFIRHHLKSVNLYTQPLSLNYSLSFDPQWKLHIRSFLFEEGDLTTANSCLIGDWAYLEEDGFYYLENKQFEEANLIIAPSKISDFVTRNRSWLNQIKGFHTHLKSLEYQVSYQVDDKGRLTFIKHLAHPQYGHNLHDFGSWVYIREEGFYPKSASPLSFLFKAGFSLNAQQISIFIKMNQEALALIPNFFAINNPLKAIQLNIQIIDEQSIEIYPYYELKEELSQKSWQLFDDYIYVKGEGFFEIPMHGRLPEKFRTFHQLQGAELNDFIKNDLNLLRPYLHLVDQRLFAPKRCQLVVSEIKKSVEEGKEWYQFCFFYQTEKGILPAIDLSQSLLQKKESRFAFFEQGRFFLDEERFAWIKQLPKKRWNKEKGTVLLTALEFARLNAYDPVQFLKKEGSEQSQEIFHQLVHFKALQQPDLKGLASKLRPYQKIGVQWLWFLYSQKMAGLLCDDMGLGKTHQAMALITSVANLFLHHLHKCPLFLIVCPTSVIYHWQEKLQKFLPKKKIYTFYGSNRQLELLKADYDILLTSYGIVRLEKERLNTIEFEVAIFDEIQVAKNQLSQVYTALKGLKAEMKIGLTGTPVENRLRELKSLFDIVLPGYLPSERHYRELFIHPIEKRDDENSKQILRRLTTPFILRRKKQEVLLDLPDKLEEVSYCALSEEQNRLYRELLQKRRHHLIKTLQDGEQPVPYMHIFVVLSSLKQICNHPALYLKKPALYKEHQSGKWQLFVELLREALQSNQKVVVFSQYLHMLDIIENYLNEQQIQYATIRGSTKNRSKQLDFFNQEPACKVFVASLQAAGLGIDLTAASVVIHYDRWWNAARENQATDRVYRIGQTKGVQVFKLVTRGTFEEKIDQMIEQKSKLMEGIVSSDDQHALKKFTRQELMSLLEFSQDVQQIEESEG